MPFFTVVVPTYNRAALLDRALRSVAAQTFGDFECLICDDGSTDDTHEVIARYAAEDSRFRRCDGPRFGLPAGPRNRGIREGRGEYVAFLDDDDVWLPRKLECQAGLAAATECDVVSVQTRMVAGTQPGSLSEAESFPRREDAFSVPFAHTLLQRSPYHTTPATAARRSVLLSVGSFDESPAYRAVEDYDLWCRLQASGAKWVMSGGPPLVTAQDASGDSISSWSNPLRPDFVRQRWAIVEIGARQLSHSALLGSADREALLDWLTRGLDSCAHKSRLVGWRRESCTAYALSAVLSARRGAAGESARRVLRGIRFGLLGNATSPSPAPETVRVLAARVRAAVLSIARRRTGSRSREAA